MIQILWDASALVKRYVAEIGSQTVNALFMAVPTAQMVTTVMSYSETFAGLWRKHNQSILSATSFKLESQGSASSATAPSAATVPLNSRRPVLC